MYTSINFKTKKELKLAVESGKQISVFQPGPFGGNAPKDGKVCLEGPHYPQMHTFYAVATLKDGYIIKVK